MKHSPEWLSTLYTHYLHSQGISTDTRAVAPGQIFFALKGPSFDGNRFAADALAKGATYAVVDDPAVCPAGDARYCCVPNALQALQTLAAHHRQQLGIPIIAITGSNGKTTTKELLRAVLTLGTNCFATPGNLNNHIGLPLCLLRLHAGHQLAILEMGDNRPGDIAELCQIAAPNYGLITNIGMDHIGGYDGMQGNANAKLELFDYLRTHGGHAFINLDDAYLAAYPRTNLAHTGYGRAQGQVQLQLVQHSLQGLTFEVHYTAWPQPQRFSIPLYGRYNLENILAVCTLALHLGCTPEQLQKGLLSYVPSNNRSQVLQHGRRTLLLDAYNANPSSMLLALEDFVALNLPHQAVVLGDMLELGQQAQAEHRKLGAWLQQHPHLMCILVGPLMAQAHAQVMHTHKHWFPTTAAAQAALPALMQGVHYILFKGSRGMALEQLVQALGV